VEKGTGKQARLFDRPVAGKTGTADGARDIWFIGFTPDTVTAVWGGNDKNLPITGNQVTGGSVMAAIWQNYMKDYYRTHPNPPGAFVAPVTPLAEEVDQIHFLPQPASIFDKINDQVSNDGTDRAPDRQMDASDQMPPLAPPINQANFGTAPAHLTHAPPAKSASHLTKKLRIKKFFNKLFNLF